MVRRSSDFFLVTLVVSALMPIINGLEREDDPSLIPYTNEIDEAHRIRPRQNLDEGPSGPGTSAANDFVDDLLKNLPKFDAQINPVRLGEFQRGGVQLTNVTLSGISDAYRHGNAQLNITQDFLHINTRLGSPKLSLRGKYLYKLPWFLPNVTGNVRLALNRIVILFDIRMSPAGPELAELKVTRLHTITVDELSGLAPFNWALRYLLEVIIRRNRQLLINELEAQSRFYLDTALRRTPGAARAMNEIDKEIERAKTEPEIIDSTEPS